MNEDTNINEYINKLPEQLRDYVFSNDFENTVMEISKKYSLDPEKAEDLYNNVLLTLVNLIDPRELAGVIKQDLETSDLLTEQIMSDLENRVFEVAIKILDKAPAGMILENRPNILPEKSPLPNEVLDRQKPPQPAQVPRYTENVAKPSGGGIIEKKLNTVTSSNNSPLKYEKDPYREPLN